MSIHLRTLLIICGHLSLGQGNYGRLCGGTGAGLVFVPTGKVARLLVTQIGRRLFDGGTIAEQFLGVVLALLGQPGPGVLAHLLDPVPVQGPHGNATHFRQRRGGPLGLAG